MAGAEHKQPATVTEPFTALTHQAVQVAAGAEECTAIQIAPFILPTSDPTSPLSPPDGQQDAGHSTTAVAATTAATATATTAAPSSQLDHVLICGHGRFQAIVLVCTTLAFFTTIVHALASANLARPLDHWCRPPAKYSYMNPDAWRNISIPVIREDDGGESRSQCQRFEPPLPDAEASAESSDNRTAVPCDAGWQYESGASSGKPRHGIFFGESRAHSIVDEWDLVCGRGWIVSALAAAYMAGGVVGAPVAYMVPTCVLVVAVYLVEESPCWLLALSELRYAENVLARAAGVNAVEPQLFKRRMSALRVELKRQHEQPGTQQEPDGAHAIVSDHEARLSDLLSNQTLRQRSAVIFGCWFLVFGTFSHLSTSHVMRTNEVARATLVILRMPCVVADVYVLKRVGRRLSLAASILTLSLAIGALSAAHVFDQLAAVLVVAGLLVFDLSAITVFVFSTELYPTVIRGAALGFCYMSGRLGAFVAPFVNEIRSPPLRSAAYAVSAAMLLLLGTLAFALPETRQLPPSNTVQGMMVAEDKWQLYSPLRVARSGAKRRRSKTTLPESHQMRRRSSSLSRQQAGVL